MFTITSEKQVRMVYLICLIQFLIIFFTRNITLVLISAVGGILASGTARRTYKAYFRKITLDKLKGQDVLKSLELEAENRKNKGYPDPDKKY